MHTIFPPRYQLLKEQAAISMQRLQWHFHVSWNWPTKCNSVWSGSPTRRHDKWRYVLLPFKQSCCQITEQTIHFTVCWWIEREREGKEESVCVSAEGFLNDRSEPVLLLWVCNVFMCCVETKKVRKETQILCCVCLSGHGVSSERHWQIVSKHPKEQSKMEVQHFCHSHLLHL